jgi:hypothetical protein
LDDQAAAQRMADAAFEAQVLSSVVSTEDTNAFSRNPIATDGEPMASAFADDMPIPAAEPVSKSAPTGVIAPEDAFRQPAEVVCAAVIKQLQGAGMVDSVDGYQELNGNPKGAVVLRLKGGKLALVVPYFESEPFALRNLRRYDMIVQVGRNGKAVVLKSLEEVIAAKLAGSMM